ncbi:MAG: NAD(P)(+) transhydrogenase (Re/Si-specific) subunit alpha, partial [Terriglobales bacterium]
MIIGVPKEIYPGDRRVAIVPAVLPTLTKAGFEVHIQSGAGADAGYPDALYADKGAKIIADRAAVFAAADIIVQILCYGSNDITGKQDVQFFRPNQILIGFLRPFGSKDIVEEIAKSGVIAFS